MLKVKRFSVNESSKSPIDNQINDWISNNVKIRVVDIKYSAIPVVYGSEAYAHINEFALVLFEDDNMEA